MARLHTGRHKVLVDLPQLPRQHRHRDQADRRPAPLGQRRRRRPASCTSSGRTSTARRSGDSPRSRSASARWSTSSRSSRSRARGTIAAIVLETIPGTAGILVPPPGYLAGVREICDRHGIVYIADEVMAGFGRTGEWFAVDKWDVAPDLITFAKGVQLRLRAARRRGHLRRDRRDVRRAGLPRRPHLLRPPAGLRRRRRHASTRWRDEGIVEQRRRDRRRRARPGPARARRAAPGVGEVRGLGVFWALDLVKDKATRELLVPYNASGDGQRADGRRSWPPARRAACCRSPTSTGCTSCRPAPSPTRRPRRAWRSSTRRSPWPTRHATG